MATFRQLLVFIGFFLLLELLPTTSRNNTISLDGQIETLRNISLATKDTSPYNITYKINNNRLSGDLFYYEKFNFVSTKEHFITLQTYNTSSSNRNNSTVLIKQSDYYGTTASTGDDIPIEKSSHGSAVRGSILINEATYKLNGVYLPSVGLAVLSAHAPYTFPINDIQNTLDDDKGNFYNTVIRNTSYHIINDRITRLQSYIQKHHKHDEIFNPNNSHNPVLNSDCSCVVYIEFKPISKQLLEETISFYDTTSSDDGLLLAEEQEFVYLSPAIISHLQISENICKGKNDEKSTKPIIQDNIKLLHSTTYKQKLRNFLVFDMIVTLYQIYQTIKLMDTTITHSQTMKISITTISMQTVLDAFMAVFAMSFSLTRDVSNDIPDGEFNFLTGTAISLLKFVLFSVLEVRFISILLSVQQREAPRNMIHKYFLGPFACLVILVQVLSEYEFAVYCMIFIGYSFFIPQIYQSAYRNTRKALPRDYVFGIASSRLLLPAYLFGCEYNIGNQWNTTVDNTNIKGFLIWLVLYVIIQCIIVLCQEVYGARFFCCYPKGKIEVILGLPPAHDYYPLLVDDGDYVIVDVEQDESTRDYQEIHDDDDNDDDLGQQEQRNRKDRGRGGGGGLVDKKCSICTDIVETSIARNNRGDGIGASGYMLTPCRHLFHSGCLQKWMVVKLECPTCRSELPDV